MRIKGNNIVVMYEIGGVWKTLAYGLSCELDIVAETIRVRNPLTGRWMNAKKKRLSWSATSSHLLSNTYGWLHPRDLILSDSPVRVMVGSVGDHENGIDYKEYQPDGLFSFVGDALVTRCTVTANKGTTCTLSMELVGTGEPEWAGVSALASSEKEINITEGNV